MPRPEFGELQELQRVSLDPELLSRGTGERVLLRESTVYDFMPPMLGNRFRVDPVLRRGVHFFSDAGSFMMGEEAFQELATNELNAGHLVPAIEAYKRGLHKAVGFAGAMTMRGDRALLSQDEIDRFNLPRRFGAIERRSIAMLIEAGEDTKINLPEYAAWVADIRRLEREALRLNRAFFGLTPKYNTYELPRGDKRIWERDTSLKGDLTTGTQLRDTYAEMQQYRHAALISGGLGDEEAKARFEEQAKTDPKDPAGYKEILWRIQEKYDRNRDYL